MSRIKVSCVPIEGFLNSNGWRGCFPAVGTVNRLPLIEAEWICSEMEGEIKGAPLAAISGAQEIHVSSGGGQRASDERVELPP